MDHGKVLMGEIYSMFVKFSCLGPDVIRLVYLGGRKCCGCTGTWHMQFTLNFTWKKRFWNDQILQS